MARLTYADGRFEFIFDRDRAQPDVVPHREDGWEYTGSGWSTVDPRLARQFKQYADTKAWRQLGRIFLERRKFFEEEFRLTHPHWLTPKNYQRFAAKFALAQNRSYLALDAGLGKTIVAALILNSLPDEAVYICPPYLTLTVAAELRRWSVDLDVDVYPDPVLPDRQGVIHYHSVYILPDSRLHEDEIRTVIGRMVAEAHQAGRTPTLIVDEAHRMKSLGSRRCRALFQAYVPAFKRIVFMSGTPMPNRPIELWPVLSECAPETIDFMTEVEFGQRFCGGRYVEGRGWNFGFASHTEELAERIHHTFMLRLRKADVLPELPPKLEEMIVLGEDLPPDVAELDQTILRQVSPEDLMGARLASAVGHTEETLPLATYRCLLGTVKAKAALPYITGLLEDTDENILVFAFHKEAIRILTEGLEAFKPIVIVGNTKTKDRHAAVAAFQDPALGHRVVVANYVAGGTGFNMVKATRVLFVEASWCPAENDQASDRPHRVGQTEPVTVGYMVYTNSIDAAVMHAVMRKKKTTRHV